MKTFKQKPITVLGQPLKVGEVAPEFNVVDNKLEAAHLSDYKSKTIVLNVVPSLDTGGMFITNQNHQSKTIELSRFNRLNYFQ